MKTALPTPFQWPGKIDEENYVQWVAYAYHVSEAQTYLTKAREQLLDAFGKSADPAPLLRLIEDLAILQERLSNIKE